MIKNTKFKNKILLSILIVLINFINTNMNYSSQPNFVDSLKNGLIPGKFFASIIITYIGKQFLYIISSGKDILKLQIELKEYKNLKNKENLTKEEKNTLKTLKEKFSKLLNEKPMSSPNILKYLEPLTTINNFILQKNIINNLDQENKINHENSESKKPQN